ncbi:MAG TPA: cupin domain-containing protein [Solirubrobacteraceae bacterium]
MQPGYAASSLDELGEGYGFRKIRGALGVTAFGCNAIVVPPGHTSHRHVHERQQELYFVHSGRIVFHVGDEEIELGPGGLLRVDPEVPRGFRNLSDSEPAVYLCVGGDGGYVGRDATPVE